MTPPGLRTTERKRQRPRHVPIVDDDDGAQSDGNDSRVGGDDATRPGQAERKRELERNRRNLVNVRFAELEIELARPAPRADPVGRLTRLHGEDEKSIPTKGKRIDKEAVLKEAAQRLANQRSDLLTAAERMNAMTAEIENLRAEKVELRNDKNYLRTELETIRADCGRLRIDNFGLWEAFRGATAMKGAVVPDVAKFSPESLMRNSFLSREHVTTAPACVPAVQSLPSLPNPQGLQPSQEPHQISQKNINPSPPQQPQQQQRTGSQQPPRQNLSLDGGPPNPLDPAFSSLLSPALPNQPHESNVSLPQSDDLGSLFPSYVPGAVMACYPSQPVTRLESMQIAIDPRNHLGRDHAPRTGSGSRGPPPRDAEQDLAPVESQSSGSSGKENAEDQDLISDIAYCV